MNLPICFARGTDTNNWDYHYKVNNPNGAILQSVVLANRTTSSVTVELWIQGTISNPSGSGFYVLENVIAPKDSIIIPNLHLVLKDGDEIWQGCDAGKTFYYCYSGILL